MKISPSAIKNAIIAQGNVQNRLFDLGVTLSDGTIAYLNVEKDTARTTTYKDGTWTDLYTLATKDDLAPVKYTEFTAGTGKTIVVNNSYCVGKLLIACLKVKIEGTGSQVVKIASNILNSGGTTIVGIGTEWSVTKSIYMYIGYDSLVVNEEDFALGQYLHIYVPLVLK